jgi:hypothetical protein
VILLWKLEFCITVQITVQALSPFCLMRTIAYVAPLFKRFTKLCELSLFIYLILSCCAFSCASSYDEISLILSCHRIAISRKNRRCSLPCLTRFSALQCPTTLCQARGRWSVCSLCCPLLAVSRWSGAEHRGKWCRQNRDSSSRLKLVKSHHTFVATTRLRLH